MHKEIAGCETRYIGLSVSEAYLAGQCGEATHNHLRAFINMSQMTLSRMSIIETTDFD